MPQPPIALLALVLVFLVAGGLAATIAFGGPGPLAPLQSVSDPFKALDFSDLPPLARFVARDGVPLAYRVYGRPGAAGMGSVVLIHGSSARSDSIHPLAKGFAQAGKVVYALDVRGHGESGDKGRVAYIGQLEDDLEDFMNAIRPTEPKSLVGFSAGGGFVLRFAADPRRRRFDNYLLLAPFLGQDASTYRPASGGWVSVGMPRTLGLIVLNRVGITSFNDLSVIVYALPPQAQKLLTPSLSFALAMNFRPHHDYRADMAAANQPMAVMVGQNDDQFFPDRFAPEFSAAGRDVPVSIVPGIGHIELTLAPRAIQAAVEAVARLNAGACLSPAPSTPQRAASGAG